MGGSFNVEFREMGQYLLAEVSGGMVFFENGAELIDLLESESKKRGYNLLLIDALRVGPPESEIVRFELGVYASEKFSPGLKVAAVYPQELINKFTEDTAVNRGAIIIVVGSREEALEWLLGHIPDETNVGGA